ncbi:unnamed protein product [Caenorhabditis bovis]|uniref:GPS domain-containing protein n=1 Tax=Caenorhabditis bovis TaxID=2654633 RepID=A0A8S1FDJ5_9PELO|nr:unnamed protein product [Caenorhabditis bovis]
MKAKLIISILALVLTEHCSRAYPDSKPHETVHAPIFTDVYDLRIHEGADSGSRLTMGAELQKAIEKMGHCFGQIESDVDWIEYRSQRGAFYTSSQMPISVSKTSDNLVGTLHLLCAGNHMHTFPFKVHVTHRNHHAPVFSKPFYNIYVPISLPIGATIARLSVSDNDSVIYNAERRLAFTKEQKLLEIAQDGAIRLKSNLASLTAYTPIRLQVLAIDYGSPQMFTIANLTIIPVTVSAVRNAHVNIATDSYQIFEWDAPEYGKADKFRLSIRRDAQTIYEEELESMKTMVLTKIKIDRSQNTSFQIASIDGNGETLTEWEPIRLIEKVLKCDGECSRGGLPLCYFGPYNRVEQFVDARGPHCLCFPGFIGVTCSAIDRCPEERIVGPYGGIDWQSVNTNTTLRLPCPYNQPTENQFIERKCEWNADSGRAGWEKPAERDRCTHQTSVLTHLGMIGTFASRATTVSALNTATTFIRKMLMMPAFSRETSKYAHFDQKIAEMATLVLDSIIQTNLDRLEGNTTILRGDTWDVIDEFSRSLPVPYALSSPDTGIYMKSIEWTKRSDINDNLIGKKCRIQLPTIEEDHVVRTICTSNATLFELLDSKSPILSVQSDSDDDFPFSRISIFMRFPDRRDNYTCVYYDDEEKAWSTKGIRRIEHNYHGYVKCETNHFGVFALLPDRLFYNSESFWKDLASHMPTVTSFVTLICTILLLFMAAVQKNQSIDFAFLLYLFFIFMIHLVHLLLFLAPQVGEPFTFTTMLHFILQFCVIAASALLSLVLYSVHSTIISYDVSKVDEQAACYSRPLHVFALGIFIPSLFTFTTYYFLDGRDIDVARVLERIDWLFITNYLLPTAIFYSIAVVYAVWNMYIGSGGKNNRRCSSDMALAPAISASVTSLFMIFFFCSLLLLFFFRDESPLVVFLFCVFQFFHVVTAFFFASYLFRLRFLLQRGIDAADTTDSLERKRDISRALLEHVATKSDISSEPACASYDGGFVDAGFSESPNYNYAPREYIANEQQRYLTFNHNIFERAPMVSIV